MGPRSLVSLIDNNWKDKFISNPDLITDIYFQDYYYKLFEVYGDGKSCCFTFQIKDEIAIYPFLLNEINGLGFELEDQYFDIQGAYGYNGVITNSNRSEFIKKFHAELESYCLENNIVAEFTRFHPVLENHKFSQDYFNVYLDRETVVLDLTQSYDEIWLGNYSSRNRNMVRKAQRMGYIAEISDNPPESEIIDFCTVYQKTMEKVGADNYYFFNKNFFLNTFKYLHGSACLCNIFNNSLQLVSSAIFLNYGENFHYHFSGRETISDNSATNFLLDEAVKYAKKIGAKKFHFGGGTTSDPKDSLLKFKGSFSKTKIPFFIGKKIHNQEIYNEIVKQWEQKFPEKKEVLKNILLKYRY